MLNRASAALAPLVPAIAVATLIAAVTAAMTAAPALADEAYVCDAGRIVYVKPGELEALKKTDACIAGYYGLTLPPKVEVAGPAKGPASAAAVAAPGPLDAAAAALQRERDALAAAAKPARPAAKAQPIAAAMPNATPVATPVAAVAVRAADPRPAQARPVEAAPATDYRNVVVINAQAGSSRIFRHER